MGCLLFITALGLLLFVLYLFTVSVPLGIIVATALGVGSYFLLKAINGMGSAGP